MKAETVREQVTANLVELIESGGLGEWEMPWHRLPTAQPSNVKSGRRYRNGNAMGLWFKMMLTRWTSGTFGTYNQWKGLGAQVRKGERGTGILIPITKRDEDTDTERVVGWKGIAVFAAEQVDGYQTEEPAGQDRNPAERIRSAQEWTDRVVDAGEISFTEDGDRAFWSRTTDRVQVPMFGLFATAEAFYATAWHELCHWTGHPDRLARDQATTTDEVYAREELVAELGAAFLCAENGWSSRAREDHAPYLASWLRLLKSDPSALWTAASHATRAVDYLHQLADR